MIEIKIPSWDQAKRTLLVTLFAMAIVTVGVGFFTTHEAVTAENVERHGIIEDVSIVKDLGPDDIEVSLASDSVDSVSVYLYDTEGHERASAKHVYTGTTLTLTPEDLVGGERLRIAAIAPNGTVVGSVSFTYRSRRVSNE